MAKAKRSKSDSHTDNIYPLCDFLNDLGDVCEFKTPRHYCFILGSGASLPSGIMSGRELTTNWLKELYRRFHPSVTLTSRNNLALLYKAKGDYDKALPLLEQTLTGRERVLGTEHPDTLTSRNNLALLYKVKGDYDKALPLYEQTLVVSERVLGAEHPATLTSHNNLASLYQAKGDYDKALALFEQTLKVCEKTLGLKHPKTRTIRENFQLCRDKFNSGEDGGTAGAVNKL